MLVGLVWVKRKQEEDEVEANEIVYTLLDGTIPPLAQIWQGETRAVLQD